MDIPPPCSVEELELIATSISSGFDPLKILIPPPFPDEELLFIVTLVILESQASQLMPPPPILAKFEKTFDQFLIIFLRFQFLTLRPQRLVQLKFHFLF